MSTVLLFPDAAVTLTYRHCVVAPDTNTAVDVKVKSLNVPGPVTAPVKALTPAISVEPLVGLVPMQN